MQIKKQFNLFKIIFILIFLPNLINGQVPTWQWAKTTGGSNDQYTRKTVTDNNGNLYALGHFKYPEIFFNNITLTTTYSRALFVSKYNSNGDVVWAKKIESVGGLTQRTLSIDKDNNLIVGGTVNIYNSNSDVSFDSGKLILNFTTNFSRNKLFFIAKFDTDGNILWAKNNQGNSEPISIEVDDANTIYCLGSFESSTVIFDGISLNNLGQPDIFITKYNENGNVAWAKSFGGSGHESPKQIIKNSDGSFTVIGCFGSPTITFENTTLTNNSGAFNLFIIKIDSEGNLISAINGGLVPNDYSDFLKLDKNDNFYLYGYFETPTIMIGGTELTKIGDTDIYIAKYNTNGILSWAKNFGNIGCNSNLTDITTDSNRNIYLAADFTSPTFTLGNSTYINDGYYTSLILKLNENGNIVWGKSALGNNDISKGNYPTSIVVNYNNDLFVTGVYNSQTVSFDNNFISNTDTHTKIYMASLIQSNLPNQEFNKSLIKLHPNPVKNILNFESDQNSIGNNYYINDVMGRVITSGIIRNKIDKIDVSNLKNGLYFFNTNIGSTIKFIKE